MLVLLLMGAAGCEGPPGNQDPRPGNPHDCPVSGWQMATALPVPLAHPAAAVLRSEVAVFGEQRASYIYDVRSGTWRSGVELGFDTPRPLAVRLDEKTVLLVADGTASSPAVLFRDDFREPDNAGNTPRGLGPTIALKGGQAVAIGGRGGQPGEGIVRFRGAGDWQSGVVLSVARSRHFIVRLIDGRVVVGGGRDVSGDPLDHVEIFDPVAGTVQAGPPLLSPRSDAAAVLLGDDRVMVVGGRGQDDAALPTVDILAPDGSEWEPGPPLHTGRSGHRLLTTHGGGVLAFGGEGAGSELFDLRTNSWRTMAQMKIRRDGAATVILPNKQLMAIGGANSATPIADTELFCPPRVRL